MAKMQSIFGLLLTLIGEYGHADEIRMGNGNEEGVTYIEDCGDSYNVYDVERGSRQGVKSCLPAPLAAEAALKKIAVSEKEYLLMVNDLNERLSKCPKGECQNNNE
jgi:hypothetical protein